MNEIKVAENKTLKLTNVVSRRVMPEELVNQDDDQAVVDVFMETK